MITNLRGMWKLLRGLLVVFALLGAGSSYGQEAEGDGGKSAGMSKKQQEKSLAKKERKKKKEVAKEEKRLLKQHRKHQDKATQKRMKRNQKRADKHGQGRHRDPFLKRLFTR